MRSALLGLSDLINLFFAILIQLTYHTKPILDGHSLVVTDNLTIFVIVCIIPKGFQRNWGGYYV